MSINVKVTPKTTPIIESQSAEGREAFEAINKIVDALKDLPKEQQQRVLRTACVFFEVGIIN